MRNADVSLTGASTVLVAGFLLLFVTGGARFVIGLTLKPMAEDLAWGRSTIGLAVAVFSLVSAACMFIAGRLADRYSPRLVLGAGLASSAFGIGFMGLVEAPWQALVLYGGLFAIGNGIASLTPIGVMVNRWFPHRTGLANAVAISGIGAGQLVMIAGFAAVLVDIGWQAVYGWLGVVHVLLIPLILVAMRSRPGPDRAQQAPAQGTLIEALRSRHFALLAVVFAICGFQDFFVATHVVAFAQDRGVETLLAGNLLAFMGFTGLLGVLLAGAWSDRSGPVWATLACFVLRVGLFGAILSDQQVPSIAVFALLFGTTFWMTAPLTLIFVRDAFGTAHLGALSGLIVMIHHMCGGLGALLGAVMFDSQGHYDTVFILMLVLAALAGVLTMGMRKTSSGRGPGVRGS
ncbi:MAG: MFS transporter [Gammaproteobacteria bacterium]|nr:MFS transporter [Gammaproteobacteria bacterium]